MPKQKAKASPTPSAFGTSPKYNIESLNVNKALACRIWRRLGAGASLRELQSATGEELDALLPSVLDRAFKGEL